MPAEVITIVKFRNNDGKLRETQIYKHVYEKKRAADKERADALKERDRNGKTWFKGVWDDWMTKEEYAKMTARVKETPLTVEEKIIKLKEEEEKKTFKTELAVVEEEQTDPSTGETTIKRKYTKKVKPTI